MNPTLPVPVADLAPAGDKAFEWLGKLWTNIFTDSNLLRGWTAAQGHLSAQLYLDFLETLHLPDRRSSPVFHRDRWRMLTIKRSERNTGPAAALRLGGRYTPVIGPQVSAPFTPGVTPRIGGHIAIAGRTTYPIDKGIEKIVTVITDNIVNPAHMLVNGVDFEVEDSTLVFYRHKDPFDLGFPMRTVSDTDTEDTEVALWACDVLVDRNYVYDYLGHVLGIRDRSSEFYARYLNALWDVYNSGASPELFRSGVAALLDEPCIRETQETVQYVLTEPRHQVITDKHVYAVLPNAALRECVIPGGVLKAGDMLTQTVGVWENLNPLKLGAGGQDAARFKAAVPAMFLPPGFFRADLKHGLGVSWSAEPLVYCGEDANGNPRLRFTVYGADYDVEAFWNSFEDYCENNNIAAATCFEKELHAILTPVIGTEWGRLSAFEYFLSNYLQTNLLIVTVDSRKLSAQGRGALHTLSKLGEGLPAHTCLAVLEQLDAPSAEYNVTGQDDNAEPLLASVLADTAGTRRGCRSSLQYYDTGPRVAWVPICRREAYEANTR